MLLYCYFFLMLIVMFYLKKSILNVLLNFKVTLSCLVLHNNIFFLFKNRLAKIVVSVILLV